LIQKRTDHVGIVNWREMLEDFKYVRNRYGVTQFVIDSLMRVGIYEDDYRQQAEFVAALANFATEHRCHVHLVAHKRKSEYGERKGDSGDKSSVSGSSKITDNAHNVVEIWRNVEKSKAIGLLKDKLANGLVNREEFDEKFRDLQLEMDGKFILHKQRDGEVQDGSKMIWFHFDSFQFQDSIHGRPTSYVLNGA
jgi:twinkle protein